MEIENLLYGYTAADFSKVNAHNARQRSKLPVCVAVGSEQW